MLQAAARIADGELPWRDFWWNYGPGQPLLLGGLQELFGSSLLVWRIVRLLLAALVSVLAYALARRDASEPLALGAWLAVAGALAFPAWPSPTVAVLAIGFAAVLLAPGRPLAAGALAGAALFFRIEVGLAVVACVLLAALPAGRPAIGRAGLAAAAAALLLLGPFMVLGGSDSLEQTLGFSLGPQELQRLPLPGAAPAGAGIGDTFEHFFPYVLLAGCAAWAVLAVRQRSLHPLAPLALAGLLYLLGRADEFHLVPLAAVLPVMLAAAAQRELDAGRRLGVALAVAAGALIALYGVERAVDELARPPELAELRAPVADGVKVEPGEARALNRLLPHVRARVPPNGPLFVANPRHDLVNVGNPLLYVLAERRNATAYDVMQPGVVTEPDVQREMVADLRRERPPLVVRWDSPLADERKPGGAGRSSGVRLLDRYLALAYRPQRRFGDYVVMMRR